MAKLRRKRSAGQIRELAATQGAWAVEAFDLLQSQVDDLRQRLDELRQRIDELHETFTRFDKSRGD